MREQRQESELSEEFEVKMEMYHGSVLSPFPFTLVVDNVNKLMSVNKIACVAVCR